MIRLYEIITATVSMDPFTAFKQCIKEAYNSDDDIRRGLKYDQTTEINITHCYQYTFLESIAKTIGFSIKKELQYDHIIENKQWKFSNPHDHIINTKKYYSGQYMYIKNTDPMLKIKAEEAQKKFEQDKMLIDQWKNCIFDRFRNQHSLTRLFDGINIDSCQSYSLNDKNQELSVLNDLAKKIGFTVYSINDGKVRLIKIPVK
jgi:hypothetical protein